MERAARDEVHQREDAHGDGSIGDGHVASRLPQPGPGGSGSGEKRRVDDGWSLVAAADTGTQRRRSHRLIDNSTSTVRHDVEASTTFSDAARKNKKQKQKCSVTRIGTD